MFIPKAIRESIGIEEKSLIVIESDGEKIVIRPLRVVRVRVSQEARQEIEEALREEQELEEEKAERLVKKR